MFRELEAKDANFQGPTRQTSLPTHVSVSIESPAKKKQRISDERATEAREDPIVVSSSESDDEADGSSCNSNNASDEAASIVILSSSDDEVDSNNDDDDHDADSSANWSLTAEAAASVEESELSSAKSSIDPLVYQGKRYTSRLQKEYDEKLRCKIQCRDIQNFKLHHIVELLLNFKAKFKSSREEMNALCKLLNLFLAVDYSDDIKQKNSNNGNSGKMSKSSNIPSAKTMERMVIALCTIAYDKYAICKEECSLTLVSRGIPSLQQPQDTCPKCHGEFKSREFFWSLDICRQVQGYLAKRNWSDLEALEPSTDGSIKTLADGERYKYICI
jgi:hypothetical protein